MSNQEHTKDERYQFLSKYFSREKIRGRYRALWVDTIKAVERTGLEDSLCIDEESFQMVILDYFTDLARLKDFSDIDRVNVDKIYGYELFWFLRRRPIHIIKPIHNGFDINEKIAIGVFLPRMLAEAELPVSLDGQSGAFRGRIAYFTNLMFYNWKYRTYTQQSLELMVEAFFCGNICTRTKT